MHTCTPAAAGELAEHPSNDPRAADKDNKLAVTTCAIKTRVSQGKGCEGGAACLRRHSEVGKPSLSLHSVVFHVVGGGQRWS